MRPCPTGGDVPFNHGFYAARSHPDAHVNVDDESSNGDQRRGRVNEDGSGSTQWSSRGIFSGNHIMIPVMRRTNVHQSITHQNCFCPALKRPCGGINSSRF